MSTSAPGRKYEVVEGRSRSPGLAGTDPGFILRAVMRVGGRAHCTLTAQSPGWGPTSRGSYGLPLLLPQASGSNKVPKTRHLP